ncbi:MAG: heavy metal-binding domain-containing protein [Elusimicrobiota bacterium]|nr:heavy metal-binding domain-containing protein [Elusimicrobiota bacterium]
MKNIKLAAASDFLTGFCGVLYAADAGNAPVAVKKKQEAAVEKTKGGGIKEKAIKTALQKYNCLLCHKYKGKGGTAGVALDEHLRHHPKEELKKLLREPKKTMPPFPGTEKELDGFLMTVIPAAGSGVDVKPAVKRTLKTYVCPMGEYQSSKPGKCPKCGMSLVEKK